MKWILFLCLCLSCSAQEALVNAIMSQQHVAAAGGGAGPTYILQENWEGANAITSGTGNADLTGWTASAGSVNGDTSTTGLSLESTECITGGDGEYIRRSFGSQSEVWAYFLYRQSAAPTAR